MSVWKSDEKLVIFASSISPSKISLFEKYRVFHQLMNHFEVRLEYSAVRRTFNSLLGVSSDIFILILLLNWLAVCI